MSDKTSNSKDAIVFINARIFTGRQNDIESDATVMVVESGQIEHVGRAHDQIVLKAIAEGATVHDVQGNLVSPSFFDGHTHLLHIGASSDSIDLESCWTQEALLNTIRLEVSKQPQAKRFFCRNWMPYTTGREMTAEDLDKIDKRPMFIYAKDLHSAFCNTAGLLELGIVSEPNPPGGEICQDENGKLTGHILESAAMIYVWPHQARMTDKTTKMAQILKTIQEYVTLGYTGAIDMAADEELWSILVELKTTGRLNFRLAVHWLIKPGSRDENLSQIDRAVQLYKAYNTTTSPDLKIAGIKLICDGLIDTCTASLLEPYLNGKNPLPAWTLEEMLPVVKRADEAGLQCALHAIGDQAVRNAIEALCSSGSLGRRHRIEHLDLTHPDDAKRLGSLGILASIQPTHADPMLNKYWPDLIGQRCSHAFAYSVFHNHGAKLALGTDAPTSTREPMKTLYAATTRRSIRGDSTETVNEEFRLGLGTALQAASYGSVYSCFMEERVGSLEKGKLADFIIVELEWDANLLPRGKVRSTWKDGKQIF